MLQTKVALKIKQHILFSVTSEIHVVYLIMWKNVVEPEQGTDNTRVKCTLHAV
jgi:hypothetical protein